MSKIVTDGALMSCTLGDIDSALIVDSQSFVSISSKFIGTETDNQGLKNIPSLDFVSVVLRILLVFSATRLAAYNTERLHQWNEKIDGAVILYVC